MGDYILEFKKGLKLVSVIFASTLVLAACGSDDAADAGKTAVVESGKLQDGSYMLEEKNLDDNGWSVVFGMTVEDNKITESNYDYVNSAGEFKTADAEYQKAMEEKVGTGPAEYIPAYNQSFVEVQDPSSVEVISGATHSYDLFVGYAQQLVDAATEGNTEKIEIDN